jgi:methylphosphotriester-DNA--protein-cysteine methyltransferase
VTCLTSQRRPAVEGLAFSALPDSTRANLVIGLLPAGTATTGEVASRLGCANAPALIRAVRRWTGTTPRTIRELTEAALESRVVARAGDGTER